MLFITKYNNHIAFSLLIFALVLSTFLLLNFYKFKKVEMQKLAMIYDDLEKEKKLSNLFKKAPQEIEKITFSTQQKLQIIKVKIINIDFTLQEIFQSQK